MNSSFPDGSFVPQGLYDPVKDSYQPEQAWGQPSYSDNQYVQSPQNETAFTPQGLYDPYAEEDQRIATEQTKLAKEIASPKYFMERDIEEAMKIPKHQREEFLGYLKQEALVQREDNKNRGILEGMGDAFNLARGRAVAAIHQFPDTLGLEISSDEDWKFVNDMLSIRSGYTDPGNQGMIQGALEGAAAFVPDVLGSLGTATIGGIAGGPVGAGMGGFAYWEARTAASLEAEMADLDITPIQRKAIAVLGAAPVAGLEYLNLGFLSAPLKTSLTKSIQKVGADYTMKLAGKFGQSKVAQAAGRYGSDYTLNMTQEALQSITEASVMSLGKVLEQEGVNDEVISYTQDQYREKMIGLWDSALPMATLIGGSRAAGSITKIPSGLKYLADKTDVQLKKMFDVDAESIKKIIGKTGVPSRKELRDIGYDENTNAAERQSIKEELAEIAQANNYFDPEETATPAVVPRGEQEVIGGYALPQMEPQQREDPDADISFDPSEFEDTADAYDDSDISFNPSEFTEEVSQESHYEQLETEFKGQTVKSLNEYMSRHDIALNSTDFGSLKSGRVKSIIEYEKNLDSVSQKYGVDKETVKGLVNDQWAAHKLEESSRARTEPIENYISPPKVMKQGKPDPKSGKGPFGTGLNIHEMKLNPIRTLIRKLRAKTGSQQLSSKNPSIEEARYEAFSLLDELDANLWPGLDELGDTFSRNDLGIDESMNPSEFAKQEILTFLESKLEAPVKSSLEFMEDAVGRYAENEAIYNEANMVASLNPDTGEKVFGFGAGALAKFKDYTPKRNLNEVDILRARSLTPKFKTRQDQNNGIQFEGALSYVKGLAADFAEDLVKRRKYLDMNKEDDRIVRSMLRKLEGRLRAATSDTMYQIIAILNDLTDSEKKLFQDLLVLEDMNAQYEIVQDKSAFRNGIETEEELLKNLSGAREAVKQVPAVTEALKKRERIIVPLVEELVKNELIPKESLDNPMAYFHRQVMIHQAASIQQKNYERRMKRKQTSMVNKARSLAEQKLGYQTPRRSDQDMSMADYDYNTNYIQSEFEWLTQSRQQLLQMEFMEEVSRRFDKMPQLEAQAKQENLIKWMGGKKKYEQVMDYRRRSRNLDERRALKKISTNQYKRRKEELTSWIKKNDPTFEFRVKKAIAASGMLKALGIPNNGDVDLPKLAQKTKNEQPESAAGKYAIQFLSAVGKQDAAMALAVGGKNKTKGVNYVTVEEIVKRDDKYGYFLALPGNRFYTVATITEATAAKIEQAVLENAKLDASDIKVREEYAVGKNKQMVLPVNIANEFNSMESAGQERGFLAKALTEWKKTVLLSPGRVPGYIIRNKLGDVEAMFMGIFGGGSSTHFSKAKELAWAFKEYRARIADIQAKGEKLSDKDQRIADLLEEMIRLDVIGSSATVQEMTQHAQMRRFTEVSDGSFSSYAKKKFFNIYDGWYQKAGEYAEFSENLTRIMAYMHYKEKLNKKQDFSYGGSDKKYVDTIRKEFGEDEAAGQLARDLLGDYGETSVLVERLSKTYIPFAKFQGINAERMVRMIKNNLVEAKEGSDSKAYGVSALAVARQVLPYATMMMWNKLFWADEEDDLAVYDRANAHLILYKREDGSLIFIRNHSVTADFLEWFGFNSFFPLMQQYRDGKIGIDDIAWEMFKDPVNKIAGSVTPVIKGPAEVLMEKSIFPDAFNTRPISKTDAAVGTVMSPETLKMGRGALTGSGERARPGHYEWPNILGAAISNPKDNALTDTYALIKSYKDSKGIPTPNYGASATKNLKRAAQFDDYESFKKAKRVFIENGGDATKFKNSIKNYDPVDRMNREQEQEFMNEYINDYDRERVHVARDYMKRVQGKMWKWWVDSDQEVNPGEISKVFRKHVASKVGIFGSKHKKKINSQTGETWESEYRKNAEWLKDRDISVDDAMKHLGERYKDSKTGAETRSANLRRARSLLKKHMELTND